MQVQNTAKSRYPPPNLRLSTNKNRCYCGTTLPTLNSPSTCSTTAKLVCPGNTTTYCGAPSLLSLWNSTTYEPPPPPPPFPTNTTTITFPNNTSTTQSNPNITATYLSCVKEPPTLNNAAVTRALSALATTSPNMPNPLCSSFCASHGYALFGTEYDLECYRAQPF